MKWIALEDKCSLWLSFLLPGFLSLFGTTNKQWPGLQRATNYSGYCNCILYNCAFLNVMIKILKLAGMVEDTLKKKKIPLPITKKPYSSYKSLAGRGCHMATHYSNSSPKHEKRKKPVGKLVSTPPISTLFHSPMIKVAQAPAMALDLGGEVTASAKIPFLHT